MTVVTLIKLALVAGTVYATHRLGVWEGPEKSVYLYEEAKCRLRPYTEDFARQWCCWKCEVCNNQEPKPWRESLADAWNDTVKRGFQALERVPEYCTRFSDDVQQTVNSLINGSKPQ